MRFNRDAGDFVKDVTNTLEGCNDMWCPSETQFGTKWLPFTFLGIDMSIDKDKSMETIKVMWYCYLIQIVISMLPTVMACLGRCCSGDGDGHEKRANVAGGSSSFSCFLIGIFGLLAIKFDCRELLMGSTITAIISICLTIVYLLIMLCGLCQLCRQSDGCCDRLYSLILFTVGCVWVIAASAIDIYLIYASWPFLFNESLDDTISDVSDQLNQ